MIKSLQADRSANHDNRQHTTGGSDLAVLFSANTDEPEVVPRPQGIDAISDNEPPLQMGDDGDDIGKREPVSQVAVRDMLNSGHGYTVRDLGTVKAVHRTDCEVCKGPMPTPAGDDEIDWLCQYDDTLQTPASVFCNCPWCLAYTDYLQGKYRPRGGRPAKRCRSADCNRKAAAERKRKQRGKATPATTPPVASSRKAWRDGTVPRACSATSEGTGGRW